MGFCSCFFIVAATYPVAKKPFNQMKFLIDPYMRSQMEKIECQTCGWIGTARDLIAEGNKYRELGMLGLAAQYYEYVLDKFPGTEWEEDAKALIEQIETQIRSENRW